MKQKEKVEGCPFCGSERVEPRFWFRGVSLKCRECGAMFKFTNVTREEFLEKWNRRLGNPTISDYDDLRYRMNRQAEQLAKTISELGKICPDNSFSTMQICNFDDYVVVILAQVGKLNVTLRLNEEHK